MQVRGVGAEWNALTIPQWRCELWLLFSLRLGVIGFMDVECMSGRRVIMEGISLRMTQRIRGNMSCTYVQV